MATALDIDSAGNAYLNGSTISINFPTTSGVFDVSQNGGSDGFVTKVNPDATALVYSTFLGGSGSDLPEGIAVDESGSAYVTGTAPDSTTNFPITLGAYQTTHKGDRDAYVTKLNSTGSALIYSTFLGGTDTDHSGGIDIDSVGSAFVTGSTISTDFPTWGLIDDTANGQMMFL